MVWLAAMDHCVQKIAQKCYYDGGWPQVQRERAMFISVQMDPSCHFLILFHYLSREKSIWKFLVNGPLYVFIIMMLSVCSSNYFEM